MANTTNLNMTKLAGTEKQKTFPTTFNGNMDAIDGAFGAGFGVSGKPTVNAEINSLADGLAIISNNNTHAAITAGQFVYVRGHGSLSDGLYVATSNISANGTLSGSNLTADTSGGLNALNSKSSSALAAGITLFKYGSMRIINCTNGSGSISTDGLDIGETAVAAPSSAYCMYYDGSSNKEGILRVDGTKVYVRNTSGTNVSASYIQGQIVYYV